MALDSELPTDASGKKSNVGPDALKGARDEALDVLARKPKGRKQQETDRVRPSPQHEARGEANGHNPATVQKQYQFEMHYAKGRVRYGVNGDGTTFGVFESNPDADGKYTETHYGHKNPSENFTATITVNRGTKTIAYDNGGKRVIHQDGSGYVQSGRAADNSYEVAVFGPQGTPRFRVSVARTADGATTYSYDNGNWRKVFEDGSKTESTLLADSKTREERRTDANGRVRHIEDIESDGTKRVLKDVSEKDILTQLIDSKVSRPEIRTMFFDFMDQFENRALKDHLRPNEVAATYREASRLLDEEGRDRKHPDRMAALAGHLLRNAARPDQVSAGDHHTERIAAVESTVYSLNPSAAAKLVADMAINGYFSDSRHNLVKVDTAPHDTSITFFPRDGDRNHASEIFQVTAVNLALAEKRIGREPRMEYIQSSADAIGREDTGERLLIPARDGTMREVLNRGHPVRRPPLTDEDVAALPAAISSKSHVPYLVHLLSTSGNTDNLTRVMSLKELQDTLSSLSANSPSGEMQALAKIFPINEPFWSDRKHKPTEIPNREQEQTIAITRFIPGDGINHGWVEVNSQSGSAGVHEGSKAIPLEDLYRCMRTADKNIPELRREIARDGSESFDPLKQLALLRMTVSDDPIRQRDTATQLRELARNYSLEQLRNENQLNQDECKRLVSGIDDIALHLPTKLALGVIEQERINGILNNHEYDHRLATLAWQVRREQARDAIWDRRINAASNRRRLAEIYSRIHPLSGERKAEIQDKISELLLLYP